MPISELITCKGYTRKFNITMQFLSNIYFYVKSQDQSQGLSTTQIESNTFFFFKETGSGSVLIKFYWNQAGGVVYG